MKTQVVLVLALAAVCGAAQQAIADTYHVTLCAEYVTEYIDRLAGDYWTGTDHKVARGARFRVYNANHTIMFYDDYAGLDGCTPDPVGFPAGYSYWVHVYSDAVLTDGNRVMLYDDTSSPIFFNQQFSFTPTYDGTAPPFHFVNQYSNKNEADVAAAIGYTVRWHPGGLSNNNFIAYTEGCPGGGASCQSGGAVYIHPNNTHRKFVMAHEIGHLVLYKRNGNQGSGVDYSDRGTPGPLCLSVPGPGEGDDHRLFSREFQRGGAAEGIANFWASATWNDQSESSCDFYWHQVDWNNDGIKEGPIYNCETTWNYMHNWCSSPLSARSVELDWLAFWWDFFKNDGWLTGDIASIWVNAEPQNWTNSTVYTSLKDAAVEYGIPEAAWVISAAYHGVNH
jgi:hypothetical protein